MDFAFYALLVTTAAVVYSLIAREVQYRFGNRKEFEDFQKRSNALAKEMKEASDRKDEKKVNELLKKQSEMMPEMTRLMLGQFKMMVPILVMFFAFTWVVSTFDPTTKDDITINLADDGKSCDAKAGDGIFSACYTPAADNMNYGAWAVEVKALNGNNVIGENSTYFFYNVNDDSAHVKQQKGDPVGISLSPQKLGKGEELKITSYSAKAHAMTATFDNGTRFYVDLPFAIPLIEVKRINEAYWWFIFVVIISGILISLIAGKIKKPTLLGTENPKPKTEIGADK